MQRAASAAVITNAAARLLRAGQFDDIVASSARGQLHGRRASGRPSG